MKIYLGIGQFQAPEGFSTVAVSALSELSTESVEEIQAPTILEKVPDLVEFMNHVYRVLTPGGKAVFQCGYYGSASSFVSPLVKRSISEYSMNWCSKEWREQNKYTEVTTDIDFAVAAGMATDAALNLRSEEVQALWRSTRLNCVQQIHFTLTKK